MVHCRQVIKYVDLHCCQGLAAILAGRILQYKKYFRPGLCSFCANLEKKIELVQHTGLGRSSNRCSFHPLGRVVFILEECSFHPSGNGCTLVFVPLLHFYKYFWWNPSPQNLFLFYIQILDFKRKLVRLSDREPPLSHLDKILIGAGHTRV